MASYAYKVKDIKGTIITGTIEAESDKLAAEQLWESEFFIVDIKPIVSRNLDSIFKKVTRPVSSKDMALFCRQFATLISAGVPILSCMQVLQEQTQNMRLKEAIISILERLEGGNSLASSARAFPKVFPQVFINMVASGEFSGTIDVVMERLAIHFEREHEIREKVKSAMTYPVAISLMGMSGVVFMLVFVLPKFVAMLSLIGAELPLPTKIVMGISWVLRKYWWLALALLIGSIFGLKKAAQKESVREYLDYLIIKTPIFGTMVQKMIVSRFARTLGTMIKSGVPIIEALETVKNVAGNVLVVKELELARENIMAGKGIAGTFKNSKVFPPMTAHMIAVGEETGSLDFLLEKIAFFYDREVDNTVTRLSALIEPIMVVFLGVVMGFIIIAMLMPMFKIMTMAP